MKKPKLSTAQIWNMSMGFLGIQFGFALQNANASRIFAKLLELILKVYHGFGLQPRLQV